MFFVIFSLQHHTELSLYPTRGTVVRHKEAFPTRPGCSDPRDRGKTLSLWLGAWRDLALVGDAFSHVVNVC